MLINDEFTVKIEKFLNEGNGLAHIDSFPIFVDSVCVGDIVKIRIKSVNKTYARAEAVELIEKSKFRIKPVCALHNVCGSCNWQFTEYSEQLRQKKNIVSEILHKFADFNCDIQDTIPSPKIYEYRCKVQYPVSQTKVSKRILAGYYKKKSHELINIKHCPLQPNIINKINEFIKIKAFELKISGYNEKKHSGLLRHAVYRISSDGTQILVILVLNSTGYNSEIFKLAELIASEYKQVKGVCANFNDRKTNVILGENTKCIIGEDYYIEELAGIKYKVSANSFFQVNPYCAEKIFDTVKSLITSKITAPRILDAYSGVSSFGIWLASIAKEVVSVEEAISASKDAAENIKLNNIKNMVIKNGDAAEEFSKMIKNKETFDVSIIDPPRKGCSAESTENLVKLTSKLIIYISCNVSTLARDMDILIKKGFKPVYIQPADMFPHTFHIETVVLFEKTNNLL